ncbi:RDD family protein [Streptomyces sp. NPDC013178]|uniref:RDD family protein n=1 Tax=unclassified Streptomyces TaxID=2593676 RepID=UPI0034055E19
MTRSRASAGPRVSAVLPEPSGYPAPPSAAASVHGVPAEPLRRGGAAAVDLAIGVAVVLGPLTALDRVLGALDLGDAWLGAAAGWALAFLLLYSPLSVSRWGATPGKRLLGVEVVRAADGQRLRYGAAVARHLSNLFVNAVPVLLVVHVTAMRLGDRRQGLHDKLVGSVVVLRRR